MATIPTLARQQRLPTATGVQSPIQVLQTDVIGKAAQTAGADMTNLGLALKNQQNENHINSATINSMLKINALQSKRKKMPGLEVSGVDQETKRDLNQEYKKIYQDASSGLTGKALNKFTNSFNVLRTKSEIEIVNSGIVREKSVQEGNLFNTLSHLENLTKSDGSSIIYDMALTQGETAIDNAVINRLMKPATAEKLKIKFKQDLAENAVTGWIVSKGQLGTIPEIFKTMNQMRNGNIGDPNIENAWKILDSTKKASLINNFSKFISERATIKRLEAEEKKQNVEAFTFKNVKTIIDPNVNRADKIKALNELGTSEGVKTSVFMRLAEIAYGRVSAGFNIEATRTLQLKVFNGTATRDNIINAEGVDATVKINLLNTFDGKSKIALSRAKEIISSNPAFLPKNNIEAKLKGNELTKDQAQVYSDLQVAYDNAMTAGKPFDAPKEARDLITQYKESREGGTTPQIEIEAAKELLGEIGIETVADKNRYFEDNEDILDADEKLKIERAVKLLGLLAG